MDATTVCFRPPNNTTPPSQHLVSSMIVQRMGGHDHIALWNRGGKAGDLVMNAGDGARVAAALGLIQVQDE